MRKNIVTPTEYVVALETELAYELQVVKSLTEEQNARYKSVMGKIRGAEKEKLSMSRQAIALDVRYILGGVSANDFGGGSSGIVGSEIDSSRRKKPPSEEILK